MLTTVTYSTEFQPLLMAVSSMIVKIRKSGTAAEVADYHIPVLLESEEHTAIDSAEKLQQKIEFNRIFACRFKLEPSEMLISDDVKTFLCQQAPQQGAETMVKHLNELNNIIKQIFSSLISISLELFENPEAEGDRGIQVNILVRNCPDEAFRQYDKYVEVLLDLLPFEFTKHCFTSLNFL